MINHIINFFRRWRLGQHLAFWLLSFYVLLKLFATSDRLLFADIVYTIVFHVTLLVPVYLNLLLAVPKWLAKQKYEIYVGAFLVILILGTAFNYFMFESFVDLIFTDYYLVSYYSWWEITKFVFIYLCISMLLKLSKSWFRVNEIERQKLQYELKALKAQINPHFLFNSLTGIYQLARKNSGRTPDTVLKLADMMRYMLYESEKDFVPLGKEIEFIQNYFQLQQLRSSIPEAIALHIEGVSEGKMIAPLFFTPLIENSFKHGLMGNSNGFVNMKIDILDNRIVVELENNKGKVDTAVNEHSGIGLENVKKRLKLIYPDKHRLKIIDSEDRFTINIEIELKAK
ncbi:hypothetical protein EMN47_07085 [Prolixibacteraceae bacterium JC049]|nr:hypothetical protein [Prolixibacteraceae bacterium JC049]